MKRLIAIATILLIACQNIFAGTLFYRAHDDDSNTIGEICVPELAGEQIAAVDYDTASLSIRITANGNGVNTAYTYTGGNIDDYDGTPPAWGDPTTNAVELEAETGGCFTLHVLDEVFAVSGATEWTIFITDGGSAIMDWEVQVLAPFPWNNDWDAEVESEVDDSIGGGTGTALTAIPWNASWDAEVESEVDDSVGGGTGTALTAIPWNASWDSEVESESTDALNAYDPPTNTEMEARTIVAASYFDPSADTVVNVTNVAQSSVDEVQASALADLFNTDSGTTYGSAVSGSVVSEIADNAGGSALTAEAIVNEWESQSQADPTGFHVNVLEVGGTAQTANDNGADINAALADTAEMQGDLADGGRLDLIFDATLADTAELQSDDYPARFTGIEGATFSTGTDSLEAIRNRGDAAWTTGSGTGLTAIASGTAQSATSTTLVLASGETFGDNELIGAVAHITGGSTGVGQTRCISDNDGGTDTITVDAWATTPTGTITYELVPSLGATCPVDTDDIWQSTTRTLTAATNITSTGGTTVPQTGDSYARLGAPAGASVSADNAAIKAETATIVADTNELQGDHADGGRLDLIFDATLADTAEMQGDDVPGLISGLNDVSAAEVKTQTDQAFADYDPPTKTEMDSGFSGLNDPTAAVIAAAVMGATCEDQGGGLTVQECLSILLAEAAGTATYTSGTRTWAVSDPSGTEVRITLVYGSELDGDRSSSTLTPVTP